MTNPYLNVHCSWMWWTSFNVIPTILELGTSDKMKLTNGRSYFSSSVPIWSMILMLTWRKSFIEILVMRTTSPYMDAPEGVQRRKVNKRTRISKIDSTSPKSTWKQIAHNFFELICTPMKYFIEKLRSIQKVMLRRMVLRLNSVSGCR